MKREGHRRAIYINVLKGILMYIACLCPNLVTDEELATSVVPAVLLCDIYIYGYQHPEGFCEWHPWLY